jgi:hypothetical protein
VHLDAVIVKTKQLQDVMLQKQDSSLMLVWVNVQFLIAYNVEIIEQFVHYVKTDGIYQQLLQKFVKLVF